MAPKFLIPKAYLNLYLFINFKGRETIRYRYGNGFYYCYNFIEQIVYNQAISLMNGNINFTVSS